MTTITNAKSEDVTELVLEVVHRSHSTALFGILVFAVSATSPVYLQQRKDCGIAANQR
jgi:hypothetical protein